MAEKITASWFNKIVNAITRIKNLKQNNTGQSFSFSTEGLVETKTGKTYKLEDIQKINKIIENMAQDDLLKQTNNEYYIDKTILYNIVAIGEKGEKPTLIQKSTLDNTIASWSYIKCPNSVTYANGKKGAECNTYGTNYNGPCPHATNSGKTYYKKYTCPQGGCTREIIEKKVCNSEQCGSNGTCFNGDCKINKGWCDEYQTCQQGAFVDIRCQNVTQG